jgi:glutathione S-transferase
MMALEEKGLGGYPNKLISFDKQEHKGEDILKWNPRGQVPTFVHKNNAINESLAAIDYLETVFKDQGKRLLPDDPIQLGRVLQRKYEFSNLDKKGSELIHYIFHAKPEEIDEEERKKKLASFLEELKLWEKYASENGSDSFAVGKEISVADIVLFPTIAFYVRVGLDLGKSYPHLASYYEKLSKLPSVQKTWPPHWRGTEAPKKIFS